MGNPMKKITTELAEYVCDNLCKFPCQSSDQDELDSHCSECNMEKFINDVLNTYNSK